MEQVSAVRSGVLLSLSNADEVGALLESGSTADNSTAEGVPFVGRAVALNGTANDVFEVVGLLNISSNADFCESLIGCLGVRALFSNIPVCG